MRWAISGVLFLILALSAAGIGIAPAETNLSLLPGEVKVLEFRVYNTDAEEITADIAVSGSLEQYITLDRTVVSFLRTDRVKSISAVIRAPKTPQGLSGNLTVSADTEVTAIITVTMPQAMPTGNVIGQTGEGKDNTFAILLTVLVAGNVVFFVVAGVRKAKKTKKRLTLKNVATVEELVTLIKTVDEKTFRTHVTKDKNEFADWLESHGRPELAYRIYDLEGREQTIAALELPLPLEEKDPETLKHEVSELRRELDTFDFSEFEKVYK
jgi:hypothetical protein